MAKKNIKPNQPQPVIRTHIAKQTLEELTKENLTSAGALGGVAPAFPWGWRASLALR